MLNQLIISENNIRLVIRAIGQTSELARKRACMKVNALCNVIITGVVAKVVPHDAKSHHVVEPSQLKHSSRGGGVELISNRFGWQSTAKRLNPPMSPTVETEELRLLPGIGNPPLDYPASSGKMLPVPRGSSLGTHAPRQPERESPTSCSLKWHAKQTGTEGRRNNYTGQIPGSEFVRPGVHNT